MLPFEAGFSEKMLCHREVCLFLKEDRGEHALSRRTPADLALAKD